MALNKELHLFISKEFADPQTVKSLILNKYADRKPQWLKNGMNLYKPKFANGTPLTAEEELIVDASLKTAVLSRDWFQDIDIRECARKYGSNYIPTSFGPGYIMYPKNSEKVKDNMDFQNNYYFFHVVGPKGTIDNPIIVNDLEQSEIINRNYREVRL